MFYFGNGSDTNTQNSAPQYCFSYAEKTYFQSAFLLLAFIPMTILALHMDTRILNDIPLWVKPLKFHISVPIHLLTFAILIRFLPQKARSSMWLSTLAFVSVAATIVEIILIDFQAARGVHSHFNFSSQFDGMIYAAMGIAAVLLTLPALILGVRFIFAPVTKSFTPGFKLGTVLGLVIGFILTMTIAGYMSSLPSGHWIDAPRTDMNGLPVVGWSRQGGDLRVPHFFATHLMQILPIAGFLLDKYLGHKPKQVMGGIIAISVLGVVITLGTFVQAMSGQAFIG